VRRAIRAVDGKHPRAIATPLGYQTNLMIYGPGGYKFTDYIRYGGPLNLLVMVITITLAPLLWPLGR